jgi:hypothetical protein
MEIQPLTEAEELRACFERLRAEWSTGAQELERHVGYQGGGSRVNVWWRPGERMWAVFEESGEAGRYWCGFGTEDATQSEALVPVVEINPPISGVNPQLGGLFYRDWLGVVRFGHTGAIAGGKRGIGKAAFTKWAQELGDLAREEITWPDGRSTDVFVVAKLGDSRLPVQIAAYVRYVEQFKHSVNGAARTEAAT